MGGISAVLGEHRAVGDGGVVRGAAVAFLGTAALDVVALPWAVALAAGGCLAALPPLPRPSTRESNGGRAFAAAAVLALAPWVLAQGLYDGALAAEIAGRRAVAVARLEKAVRLDPDFPLYRMRLALLRNDPAAALVAARKAHGVAALWTVAGILGRPRRAPGLPARCLPPARSARWSRSRRFF